MGCCLLRKHLLCYRAGVHTVWTDGFGRHSSDPHHRRCGVCYYTDSQERAWLLLLGIRQSVYRAPFLVVARALEECKPRVIVSDCKGAIKAVQALQNGFRHPEGWNRDLEKRIFLALLPGQRIRSMKAYQMQAAVEHGRVTVADLDRNGQ
eukprot:1411953-Amphidinium_carterae.1